jgi:hypothetical protein
VIEHFDTHPDAPIIANQPGLGALTGAGCSPRSRPAVGSCPSCSFLLRVHADHRLTGVLVRLHLLVDVTELDVTPYGAPQTASASADIKVLMNVTSIERSRSGDADASCSCRNLSRVDTRRCGHRVNLL